jgi:Glycosyltransferase family 87
MIRAFAHRAVNQILGLPLITWVLLGFFLTFLLFFVIPVFLDPSLTIQFRPNLTIITPIGHDFRIIVSASSTWLQTGVAPAILYPPLTLLFFALFTFFSLETGYKILLLIILICFIFSTLAVPLWFNRAKDLSAFSMLILVTGFGSYGLEFEMERGQWNLIAFAFCLAGIYLFHRQPKYRWLAYVLFSISVQLKLYPAIFVFVLIDDWSDWKNNLKRIVALGLINIAALFILGINPILNSIGSLTGPNVQDLGLGTPLNHSITSFVLFIRSSDLLQSLFPLKAGRAWLSALGWIAQLLLIALFLLCFMIILRRESKKGFQGFDPYVFLACTVGALVLPSLSFDYKLSILPACILLSIPNTALFRGGKNSLGICLLAFVFSAAYSSTLYSYTNKPQLLQNNLPALLILLLVTTILSGWKSEHRLDPRSSSEPTANSSAS